MIKNIGIAALFIALVLSFGMRSMNKKCPKQNEMVNSCVVQKSGGQWIRTCG